MIDKISVILSFRNEDAVLPELLRRLRQTLDGLESDYELIFINDASTDRSLEILSREATNDKRIKIITTSRPFGKIECVLAGMKKSRGDAVIYMDTDLQDPPELIPDLLRTYEQEKADVVYTTRLSRPGESRIKLLLTGWAYRVIRFFATDVVLPPDSGDYKLLSRRCVDELLALNEKTLYLRGLISWLGFKQIQVKYHREKRYAGTSKFPVFASIGPLETFLQGVISFSNIPLYLILPCGTITVVGGILYLALAAITGAGAAGRVFWPVLVIIGGLQLCALGVIGVYIGDIHKEAKRRPRYIISNTINFEE